MNHLESLIGEYLEWQGYFVRKNTKVGALPHGGWAMEFDVVGWHPATGRVLHYEPSTDAHAWDKRVERYAKKFAAVSLIQAEVLPNIQPSSIRHIAVLPSHPVGRDTIAGFELQSIGELVQEIRTAVEQRGRGRTSAIPEHWPLLRTVQLLVSGY
jgi:hypothetical protein